VAELVNDDKMKSEVQQYLMRKSDDFDALEVTLKSVHGRAAENILSAAEESDLVVMACRGNSGLTKWLLGSVATKVVRGSVTPVMIVNTRHEEKPSPVRLKRIMVALDESERAEVALQGAARIARAFDSKLILYEGIVKVWKTSGPDTWADERAVGYLTAKKESLSGVQAEVKVYRSSIGPEIVERAEAYEADLVVMASHGRSGLSSWVLGSVTESVVQRATFPVMVFYNRP
jgi:nucleotide-binding universal stress UspA family protein